MSAYRIVVSKNNVGDYVKVLYCKVFSKECRQSNNEQMITTSNFKFLKLFWENFQMVGFRWDWQDRILGVSVVDFEVLGFCGSVVYSYDVLTAPNKGR